MMLNLKRFLTAPILLVFVFATVHCAKGQVINPNLQKNAQSPVVPLRLPNSQGENNPHLEITQPGFQAPPFKVRIERQSLPQPPKRFEDQPYRIYLQAIQPLRNSLLTSSAYVDTMSGQPLSLQRVSAFSAENKLELSHLDTKLSKNSKQYLSYRIMKRAVNELNDFTEYWIKTDRVKLVSRGDLDHETQDWLILKQKAEQFLRDVEILKKLTQQQETVLNPLQVYEDPGPPPAELQK